MAWDYSFLFMGADSEQLGRITSRIEAGALSYIETGRSKSKVKVTSGRVVPARTKHPVDARHSA